MVDNGGTLLTQVIVVWVVAMSSTLEVSCPGGGTRCYCCHLGGGGGHIIDAGGSSRRWSSSLPSEVRVVVSVTISSHIIILLTFFLYELRSWMLCAQWTYHVTPAHLLVRFPLYHMFPARVLVCPQSRFHMICYFTVSD